VELDAAQLRWAQRSPDVRLRRQHGWQHAFELEFPLRDAVHLLVSVLRLVAGELDNVLRRAKYPWQLPPRWCAVREPAVGAELAKQRPYE
jgi:hypothetical protein